MAAIIALALFGGAFAWMATRETTTSGDDPALAQAASACWVAIEYVRRTLKAPSTASFSDCSDSRETSVVRLDGARPRYRVDGYVDAENSFSAKLRSNYRAVVELDDPARKTWTLVDLKL